MQIHRLALVAACLAMLTAMTAQAARPACGSHSVATAVGNAVRKDAQDRATRIAGERLAEHAPPVVPRSAVGSVWSALASHLPHRSTTRAEPAAPPSDCR